jgi:hypothetical protein
MGGDSSWQAAMRARNEEIVRLNQAAARGGREALESNKKKSGALAAIMEQNRQHERLLEQSTSTQSVVPPGTIASEDLFLPGSATTGSSHNYASMSKEELVGLLLEKDNIIANQQFRLSSNAGPSSTHDASGGAHDIVMDNQNAADDDRHAIQSSVALRNTSPGQRSRTTSATPPVMASTSTSASELSLPLWYRKVVPAKQGDPALFKRLQYLAGDASGVKRLDGTTRDERLNLVRDTIHEFSIKRVDKATLIRGKALDVLSSIANMDFLPWDIRSDARELFKRWVSGESDKLSGDLMYGIVVGATQGSTVDDTSTTEKTGGKSLSLDKKYKDKRLFAEWGQNGLENGQWWPNQICTMRDGAHGSSQGGIAGSAGRGAWSITFSSRSQYTNAQHGDLDDGNEIWYMGTPDEKGLGGHPTTATQHMIDAHLNQKEVRVIRSHRETNKQGRPTPFTPEIGYRYDGLYKVVDYELIDVNTHHYRFHLIRSAGQDPIRCQGPEARPTRYEIAAKETLQALQSGKKRPRVD